MPTAQLLGLLFDVRVFNPHTPSNRNPTPSACYRKHEREKKRAYTHRILEVEHSSFTPLVLSATGEMGREATCFYKRLASMLAQKWDHSYSTTLCWLRCRLTFSPICSAIQSLRGARSSCCPLPSSNRPRHHLVPYHIKPIVSPQVSYFYLFCADTVSAVIHPLVVHLIQHYFQFFSFPRWRVSRTSVAMCI